MIAVRTTAAGWADRLARDGYAILDRVVGPERVAGLIEATREYAAGGHDGRLDRRGEVYGGRDLLWRVPEVARLSRSPELSAIAGSVLGPGAFAVRGLYFDKTPTANWNLPWHQDLTIAVRARREVPGFGPWTLKGGILHAHAPAALLARMVTIRLHLDDCGPASGPLRVLPGSHADGKLDAHRLATWMAAAPDRAVDCLVPAGGAVVMRPMLLHASASGIAPAHRRVIHLEYAAETLPDGLEWHQVACVDERVIRVNRTPADPADGQQVAHARIMARWVENGFVRQISTRCPASSAQYCEEIMKNGFVRRVCESSPTRDCEEIMKNGFVRAI